MTHSTIYRIPVDPMNHQQPKENMVLYYTQEKVLEILWDYGLVWISKTGNFSILSSSYASGRTPLEYITGETPDISAYL